MNIRKFLNRVKGKEKLEAFREAARYCETALPPQPAPGKEPPAQGRFTTDVTFEKTRCAVPYRLSTSEWERSISSWDEVEEALEEMQEGEVEFVILTVGEAPHGIRFIQTCPLPDREDVTVELSLEEEGKSRSRLVEKDCSMEECIAIFRAFFHTADVPDREEYKPMSFYQ